MYPADGYALTIRSKLGRDSPSTLLNEVHCIGTEKTISECPKSSSQCLLSGAAGVICPPKNGNSIIIAAHSLFMLLFLVSTQQRAALTEK